MGSEYFDQDFYGVKVGITNSGIEFLAKKALCTLESNILERPIDNISGSTIGFNYSLTEIKITSFEKPLVKVTFDKKLGALINSRNGAITVKGVWKYTFKRLFITFRDTGSITASSNSIFLNLSTRINVVSGQPHLSVTSCETSFKEVSVRLAGGRSRIYNVLLDKFKNKIMSSTAKVVCNSVTNVIEKSGNEELSTLNFKTKIKGDLILDYSLVTDPTLYLNYIEFYHRGMFIDDPMEFPECIAMSKKTDKMVGFSISENTLNSAGRVMFQKNFINYEKSFKHKVILDFFGLPTTSEVFMKVIAFEAPKFSILPSGIIATIFVYGTFDINKSNKMPTENLLAAEFRAESVINVWAEGDKLKLNIEDVRSKIGLATSDNLVIDALGIQILIDDALKSFLPMVNDSLDAAVPLPKPKNLNFVNNEITLCNGYLFISSDIN